MIEIYDTTLRDGTQGQDFNLTSEDKVAIARRLDDFGVTFIEGGWPGSNPKDVRFFELMKGVGLQRAALAAFGSTCRKGVAPEEDANLKALLDAGTPVVTIFGKSWTLHVTEALGATLEQNLVMIRESVSYLKKQGRLVIYDAEHYFDGHRDDAGYALATLEAAVDGGADRLVLCDTNGGSLPKEIAERIEEAVSRFSLPIGIHAHNDSELAVANSLAAVEAGASHVQGTVNGYGERCGNANLISILPNLVLKLRREQKQRLDQLRSLSQYIDERANLQPNVRAPFVGEAAFAHKGGVHVSAVNKRPETYEHVVPESVGNARRILVSDLSGRANVLAKIAEFGQDVETGDPAVREVVDRLKELEHRGYAFEEAEASFQLMTRKIRGDYQPYFLLHGFTVLIDKRDEDKDPRCEASIKVEVGGEFEHTAADGDGPVNALDRALGKALTRFYPSVADLELSDYKVRVLSGAETGTASVVRVLVEVTDGREVWRTVGASTNIIDASYQALIDAIEYKLVKDQVPAHKPAGQNR
ncbi:MAG: citramalate synthase [Trueperaceae bacterium]|nr:MAG: citramalate synthase [Trueperaceae bacterium]